VVSTHRSSSRRIGRPDLLRDLAAAVALHDGDVVLALKIEPELRTIPEIVPEPHDRVRGDGPTAVQDVRNASGWDAEVERQPIGAEIARLQLAPEQTAGWQPAVSSYSLW